MRVVSTEPHPAWASYRPEFEAKQTIIDCGNGYGISVIYAKGDRWGDHEKLGHGFYCNDKTCEAMLIKFRGVTITDYELIGEPLGWLTTEEVEYIAEQIGLHGPEAFKRE